MEKTNWIEKIKETVRVAMNKGLFLYGDKFGENFRFHIGKEDDEQIIIILCFKNVININTKRGVIDIEHTLSDRDSLELQALVLSIKEYREDMAISEFEEFISNKKEDITDINDLDNEDD